MAQTQRHPSRDQRPAEWESTGRGGIRLHPGGYYGHEELESAKSFWHSEGNPAEGHHVTMPSQGRLFDPEEHHAKVRQELGEKRMGGFSAYGDVAEATRAAEIRRSALGSSVIPTSHLQPRQMPHGGEAPESRFVIERGLAQNKGALGHYTGPPMDQFRTDYVTVDPEGPAQDKTAIHEMGHRHHLGVRDVSDPMIHHPQSRFPDPVMEAHADAYVDRYGGGSNQVQQMSRDIEEGYGKFHSYQYSGYSTNYEGGGWTPTDRALYAGTRAHYSETGEHTNYLPTERHPMENPRALASGGGSPTLDATIHSLLSNSPHAAQAMRQTGLKDVGQESFRRHRDRQLLGQGQQVQGSLFSEIRGADTGRVYGYTPTSDAVPDLHKWESGFDTDMARADKASGGTDLVWPHHMSHNQFGEKPRTRQDIAKTLGVQRHNAAQRGFDI